VFQISLLSFLLLYVPLKNSNKCLKALKYNLIWMHLKFMHYHQTTIVLTFIRKLFQNLKDNLVFLMSKLNSKSKMKTRESLYLSGCVGLVGNGFAWNFETSKSMNFYSLKDYLACLKNLENTQSSWENGYIKLTSSFITS